MIEATRAALIANAAFLAKIGTYEARAKVYFEEADQGATLPFVILSQIDSDVNDTKHTKSDFDQNRVQVFYYAAAYEDVSTTAGATVLANLGRTALDHVTTTYANKSVFFRHETRRTFADEYENKKVKVVEDIYEVYKDN
jgi:hypothetical protein